MSTITKLQELLEKTVGNYTNRWRIDEPNKSFRVMDIDSRDCLNPIDMATRIVSRGQKSFSDSWEFLMNGMKGVVLERGSDTNTIWDAPMDGFTYDEYMEPYLLVADALTGISGDDKDLTRPFFWDASRCKKKA